MAHELTSSDVEFVLEGLQNGCAYKMKASSGFEFWLVPDGETLDEPHLTLTELAFVREGVSPEALMQAMLVKSIFRGASLGTKPQPKKAAPKKKRAW